MEIFCCFRLVLEGKTGKEIPESRLEFLEKFLANTFALSDAEGNTSSLFIGGDIAYLTLSNLPKVQRAKFLGSDEVFWFSSICKFGNLKNPFAASDY